MYITPSYKVPDRVNSLVTVDADTVLDFSCAGVNSYPGRGQLWENLARYTTTASVNSQSKGPFYLGGSDTISTNDPTFVGDPGTKGSYFLLDGGDFFTYSGQTTDSPTLVDGYWKDIHAGVPWTFWLAFRFREHTSAQTLLSTKATGANAGITTFIGTGEAISVTQRGDTAAVTVTSTTLLVDNTDYFIGISSNGSTQSRIWIGSSTCEEFTHTYNAATIAATTPMTMGMSLNLAQTTASLGLANGTRIYAMGMLAAYKDNAAMANIINFVEAREGINLTP